MTPRITCSPRSTRCAFSTPRRGATAACRSSSTTRPTSPASEPTGVTDDARPHDARPHDVDPLLRPRSIAIVGVSPEPGSFGGAVLANLERFSYGGDVHLVSRRGGEIGGRPCLPSIDDLPEGI